MNKFVDIDNVIDKAIIKSLEYMRDNLGAKGLLAGALKDLVKEKFRIRDDDDVIQSRIRYMHKQDILLEVKPSVPRKDNKRVYALSKNLEFNYICGPLPDETGLGEVRLKEIPTEMRRHHTVELHEAIKQWIAHFPQPNAEFPFDPANQYHLDVKKCQSHLLFQDLENHLPKMDYGTWDKWRKYKEDLLELQNMKRELLSIVQNEISRCFIGFKLVFIPDLEYGINNFECNLLHRILYNLVIDLSGRIPVQEAYDNYERCIAYFRENTILVDNESTIWKQKGSDELIRVQKEKREALKTGIEMFLDLLDKIEKSHLIKSGEAIIRKVAELKQNREMMIRDLEDTLLFHSLPGECKYLSGF